MEVGELFELLAGGDFEDLGDLGVAGDLDFPGFGGEELDVGAAVGFEHARVLVDEGGIEQEVGMLEEELVFGFEDAALAEEDGLAAGEQVGDDEVPFFEGDGEGGRIVHALTHARAIQTEGSRRESCTAAI